MPAGAPTLEHKARQMARARYPAPLQIEAHKNKFSAVLDRFLGLPITREAALECFDGRATYDQIINWRFGRGEPPQWARDLLEKKIAAHYEPLLQLVRANSAG